jgi:hypothetical protein
MQAIMDGQAIDDIVPLVLQSGISSLSTAAPGGDSDDVVLGDAVRPAGLAPPSIAAIPPGPGGDVKIPTVKKRLAEASPLASVIAAPEDPHKPKLLEDVKFHPNIVNTVVFLVSVTMQACTVSGLGAASDVIDRECSSRAPLSAPHCSSFW